MFVKNKWHNIKNYTFEQRQNVLHVLICQHVVVQLFLDSVCLKVFLLVIGKPVKFLVV